MEENLLKKKLLVHVHLFYHNQTDYILEKLKNISGCEYDLFVTVVEDNEDSKSKILSIKPDAKIIKVENIGFDVWPFIQVIRQVNLDDYDLVLKLHTKNFRSNGFNVAGKYRISGYDWRNSLFDTFLKNKKHFKKLLNQFNKDEKLGSIDNKIWHWLIEHDWPEESYLLEDELKRIGFVSKYKFFSAGTMFLTRANIFKFLQEIPLDDDMFKSILATGQLGSLSHVYERILSIAVDENGYTIKSVNNIFENLKYRLKYYFRWQNIFRVKISDDLNYKIVSICGIKIKIKLKPMKLGVSYNLFDGEELLESSIKSIRNQVDYINVVYQKKSYYGNDANPNLENYLKSLVDKKLIDEIYLYDKDFTKGDKLTYEKEKRDIGLKLAIKAGCTHYLNMDVDEFYDESELNYAKEFIIKNQIEMSAAPLYEYIKSPEYRFVDSYSYTNGKNEYSFYVPFIMKANKRYSYMKSEEFPCLVDPSRRYNNKGKFYLFSLQDVVMHHMSSVRKDLNKKYLNSNANLGNSKVIITINKLKEDILNWNFEENRLGDSEYSLFQGKLIKKTGNKFGINL